MSNKIYPTLPEYSFGALESEASLGYQTLVKWLGIFCIVSIIICFYSMFTHVKNYTKPVLQRYVIRILWLVPIYSFASWISLYSLRLAFYVDLVRDVYEAFVIYCFFNLLINYLGGERELLTKLHNKHPTDHMWPVYYFYKNIEISDPYSFLALKRGILQYVYIKPLIAVATLLLKYTNNYTEGEMGLKSGYFWITFTYNLSVCTSLYCLVLFFQATKHNLKRYNPLYKFLCVKSVVFFSFWQSLIVSVIINLNLINFGLDSEETTIIIQDSLICIEMFFGALFHHYSFTYMDYIDTNRPIIVRFQLYYAIKDALGVRDIIKDSVDTFSGSKFNYRTFEPADSTSVTENGRINRIQKGLRYSHSGKKYWVDANKHSESSNKPLLIAQKRPSHNRKPSIGLLFGDPEDDETSERLYEYSRKLRYGDYNIPVVETVNKYFIADLEEFLPGCSRTISTKKNTAKPKDKRTLATDTDKPDNTLKPQKETPAELDSNKGYNPASHNYSSSSHNIWMDQ